MEATPVPPRRAQGYSGMLEQVPIGLFLTHVVDGKATIMTIVVEVFRIRTSRNQIQRKTTMVEKKS